MYSVTLSSLRARLRAACRSPRSLTAAVAVLGVASASYANAAVETCLQPRQLLAPPPTASTPPGASTSRSGCLSLRQWTSFDLEPGREGRTAPTRTARLPESLTLESEAELKSLAALPRTPAPAARPHSMTMDRFLDKLMHAESGGQAKAKNPRSTALGPFQFINSTFLAIVRRHFEDEVAGMSVEQILELRTDFDFSRRAVTAFTNENADYLRAQGIEVTYPGLRLAHLLGPAGAAVALKAAPSTALPKVFPKAVLRANPFMARLTVAGLVRRAERELGLAPAADGETRDGAESATAGSQAQADHVKPGGNSRAKRSHAVLRLAKRSAQRARTALRACKSSAGGCGKVAAAGRRGKVRFAGK